VPYKAGVTQVFVNFSICDATPWSEFPCQMVTHDHCMRKVGGGKSCWSWHARLMSPFSDACAHITSNPNYPWRGREARSLLPSAQHPQHIPQHPSRPIQMCSLVRNRRLADIYTHAPYAGGQRRAHTTPEKRQK
jgi:hypothetical protein